MRIENYSQFWEFYVQEHSKPMTRLFHFIGTLIASLLFLIILWKGLWYYFPACLLVGYGFAWFSHFFIEKNKPATFKYPLWSFISDYKMMFLMLSGKMDKEVKRIIGS